MITESNLTKHQSDNGDAENQLKCFGIGENIPLILKVICDFSLCCCNSYISAFPVGCKEYYGPHSMQCLVSLWINATCLPDGYKYPEKLTVGRLNELDTWNMRL